MSALLFILLSLNPSLVQYKIDRWNTEAGLPQNSVNSIIQASDGRLWVATFGGVAQFDGAVFTSITTGDRTGLPSDRIYALAQDGKGRIWIGSEDGLARYDHGTITRFAIENAQAGNYVRSLAAHPDGSIWFGTQNGELGRIDDAGIQLIAPPRGQFGVIIADLCVSRDGFVWFNSRTGLWRVDSQKRTSTLISDQQGARFLALAVDPQDGVWFTIETGIVHLTNQGKREYSLPVSGGVDVADIRSLVIDANGTLWLAVGQNTIWYFRPESGELRLVKDKEEQGQTTAIMADREGSIWAGNRVGGLLRIRPSLFQVFTTEDGLAHNNSAGVLVDSAGRVWVGAGCQGVAVYDKGHFSTLPPQQTARCVQTFAEDKAGNIWMGGNEAGRWHNGKFEKLFTGTGIHALFCDKSGTIWLGSNAGLFSWTGSEFKLELGRDEIPKSEIRTITQSRNGALWVGTGSGVVRYSGGKVERFSTARGLPSDDVRAIYEDTAGTLWIGTYGGGLAKFSAGKFTSLGTADGLQDNFLSSVLEDSSGNFWLSSNRGIFRVSRRDLEDRAAGRIARVHTVVYGRADGMLSAETNGGLEPAVARTADGRLWYPTLTGVAVIDPSTAVSSVAPAIALDRVIVDGKAQQPVANLSLPPGSQNVDIAYSGLSLSAPTAVTFRYRLDNWDRDWVDAAGRRTANYSHLSPGDYTFHVMAANRDGVWSGESTLQITVLPRFWQTWWFRLLAIFAIAVTPILRGRHLRRRQAELELAVDQKTQELRAQKSEIEQQAVQLLKQNEILAENVRLKDDVERISRHDLRTPLNSIISLAQIVREGPGLAPEHEASLKLIEQAGYRAMNMANLTLDLFKMEQGTYRLIPSAVEIRNVVDRVLLDLQPLIRTREVSCEVTAEAGAGRLFIRGDELLSHSLLSNLVKNAVEACSAGEVIRIGIGQVADRVVIRIHNRAAIPEHIRERLFEKYATAGKSGGTGLGAYSARLMAETQGGTIEVNTSAEEGTTVTIALIAATPASEKTETPAGSTTTNSLPVEDSPRRTVLIVDDDDNNRIILRHFLNHPKWTIDEAENGPLALRKLAGRWYDFVFLDLEMPVMNGFEVAAQIQSRLAGHRPVVVGLSSHDDPKTRDRALQSGFDHYFTKPVSRTKMLELVLGTDSPVEHADPDITALLPAFLQRQASEMHELEAAISRNDRETVRHIAHRMRGSFSIYGFAELAECCAAIERRAQDRQLEGAAPDVQRITELLNGLKPKSLGATAGR